MATSRHIDGNPMTLEEFIEFEQQSEVRHEYVEGGVHAFAGGTYEHSLISLNIAATLRRPSFRLGCHTFGSDIMVRAAANIVYYPGVTVTCDPDEDLRRLLVTRPCFIAEVLSPSTEKIDLREKLLVYRNIRTLRTLIYVRQDHREVIHHYREQDGNWTQETLAEGAIHIPCLNTDLTLDQIYEEVLE